MVTQIWRKFLSTFNVTEVGTSIAFNVFEINLLLLQGLLGYGPLRKDYILEFLRSSIEDGISYIEARTNFDRFAIFDTSLMNG